MNKISFIIEFDEISKIQEEQLREFIENTGIKFHVLESDNDLNKYKKYKDDWNKLKEYVDTYLTTTTMHLYTLNAYRNIQNKMQELEGSDGGEC